MSSSTTIRTARRRTVRVAAAALTAAAALSVTACNNSDDTASKPTAGASSADSSAGAQGSDAQPDNANGSDSGGGSANGGGKGKFCRADDLMMEAVDSSPDEKVGEVTVQMTNKGAKTCSATGFAGVDLKDIDGTSAPVHRGGEQPRITDLKPGDTATFSISYEVDFSGDSLASPTHIIVTPPNETHSVSLKWPADALKLAGPYDDKIKVHPVGIAN
ncbi:DUF4232 domain-containing protein [Streptomyces cucumeris]|uniref:DUF4232 domain-containing protein n=1 Tax=Streptomyces cucumeris TaxID=2962890 RepID=UPI0020C91A37|nr:DUF4232 domain-containing protein [Streptomyces sp. NEAU-Y11]MCP9210447.1 DUF4232 domain-containing protein [Streptomyces sp. NEAU-Y11]